MDINEQDIRTAALIGTEALARVKSARVCIVGIGGVGSFAAEALARAGVGRLTIYDADTVSVSNINRQIIALHSTVGRQKTEAMRDRILDINPLCQVECHNIFLTRESVGDLALQDFDYVVDACDTVAVKAELAVRCEALGVRLISSMGTGNKLDPTALTVSDIYKTKVCPLARAMRSELKRRGVRSLRVVYSEEEPRTPYPLGGSGEKADGRPAPASISFVPSAAGLIIASEVIRALCEEYN
ncbi:MAG: tRNA threonylcarbamoyladenosine dehydratase [Clostridia bacterium]|nr:tRNA threonylcarbamoyladenosine dehydratase [Clostridia bacterium]